MLATLDGPTPVAINDAADVLARPLDDEQFTFGLDCVIRGLAQKIENLGA
jgi:hypothetical protein